MVFLVLCVRSMSYSTMPRAEKQQSWRPKMGKWRNIIYFMMESQFPGRWVMTARFLTKGKNNLVFFTGWSVSLLLQLISAYCMHNVHTNLTIISMDLKLEHSWKRRHRFFRETQLLFISTSEAPPPNSIHSTCNDTNGTKLLFEQKLYLFVWCFSAIKVI